MKISPLVILGFFMIVFLCSCQTASPTAVIVGHPPAVSTQGIVVTPVGVIPEKVSPFDIQEVGVGEISYVSLTNYTDQPGSLKGFFLCQGKACFALPDQIVAAGETVRVAVGGGTGLQNVVASNATIGLLRPTDGEIALTTTDKPKKPEQILVYLQWGTAQHELTDLAIQAGQWLKGSYAPTSDSAVRLYRVKESGLWLFEEPKK